ncbi:hypothetical protein [Bremerella alba]|uniref:hypothetical protein n=1 Tax=Bremerella alba TaxID=980252 RepID=UPI001A9544C0|nr:hypothetical protein [Bremerella alba]
MDKPYRHRYSYGQFNLPIGDMADSLAHAMEEKVKLIVEINGYRDNSGFFGATPESARNLVEKYLNGTMSQIDLLEELNQGRRPHWFRDTT